MNRALFLDRDGTINEEKNYVYRIGDFIFRDGIFELVKQYYDAGYAIFVVTNQSGIARGLYTEADFEIVTRWMEGEFRKNGIEITRVYHCPHHPDITGECQCRKPNSGLILQALAEYDINPAQSVLIGDKESDVIAGRNAGIGTIIRINETGRVDIANGTVYKG
ncbi:MAG TPA: D,D-heptose 1,7-bisphosphate phosphatase [Prolixibacteraceae bacterium]|jgi:D-glycero-D-manno-heptose 1,7-bisphosphate phosphatase|nr:D,D-heptose 1,7-bisphosphate phosphatase [Prolixibacteraceae bacterium]